MNDIVAPKKSLKFHCDYVLVKRYIQFQRAAIENGDQIGGIF